MSPRINRSKLKTKLGANSINKCHAVEAARPSQAQIATDHLLALNDPNELPALVDVMATRTAYPESANRLQKAVSPSGAHRLVELILGRGLQPYVRVFRTACDAGFFTPAERLTQNARRSGIVADDLIRALANRKRQRAARLALLLLAFAETENGWIPIEGTSVKRPGVWPLQPRERAAVGLVLLVRRFVIGDTIEFRMVRR